VQMAEEEAFNLFSFVCGSSFSFCFSYVRHLRRAAGSWRLNLTVLGCGTAALAHP